MPKLHSHVLVYQHTPAPFTQFPSPPHTDYSTAVTWPVTCGTVVAS